MGRKKQDDNEEYEGDGEEFAALSVSGHAKRSIAAIFLFVFAVIFLLGFFDAAGVAGAKMTDLLGQIFGWGKYLATLVFVYVGIILLRKKVETKFYVTKIVGMALAFWGLLALMHLLSVDPTQFKSMASNGSGGGYLGYVLAMSLAKFLGKIAGAIVLVAVIAIGFIVAFDMSLVGLGDKVPSMKKNDSEKKFGFFSRKEDADEFTQDDEEFEEDENEDVESEVMEGDADEEFGNDEFDDVEEDIEEINVEEMPVAKTPTAADKAEEIIADRKDDTKQMTQPINVDWELPPLKLLKRSGTAAKGGDVKQRAQAIQETFQNFGIAMELEDIVTGPTVTQFSFRPQSGVKLSRITALNADLALALAAHPIRIEAPIPGKSLVGIEVPNRETAMVRMRNLLNTDEFDNPDEKLLLALGEDVNGDYILEDLAKMPHLLVAGTTGAGKSVAINGILLSLLYKNSPEDLKLILVDPKRVELSLYQGIPHLLSDVIVDNGKVVNALKWAVSEMERRYKLLQETKSKNLESYNVKRKAGGERTYADPDTDEMVTEPMENLPVIVIVIDELSDLMSSHGKEVEGVIVRLAQMSRAIGIHLILSTQRPSVEVITGLIKANMPTRIALKVNSSIDSRTILDATGAEKLVGNGDMLFSGPNTSTPVRLQNPYVSEDEIEKVVNFIKRQAESTGAYSIDEDFGDEESGGATGLTSVDFSSPVGVGGSNSNSGESEDAVYGEAKEIVIAAGKASTSYLQRQLRIGYSRAARLMDELEENGVVSPPDGSKPRKILVQQENSEVQEIDEA
ncbi:MAG: DNA translocase FtsK [Candidatus Moraniibacteriota bacterium]|jgi:DNA segregation ATPase FtsK/SpoIIIE, S-DNA-T family